LAEGSRTATGEKLESISLSDLAKRLYPKDNNQNYILLFGDVIGKGKAVIVYELWV
jgi:hypothetical protein